MKRLFASFGIWVALSPLVSEAFAVSMGSAQITAVRNVVEKVENNQGRPAVVSDQVTEGDMVRTRAASLAELTFTDKTITRMGANSQFSYSAQERLVKIEKGTVLMHTPPGNGGATITSGGVTGAISGTSFLLTANPAICTKKPCQQQMKERPNELDPLKRYYCEDHPDVPQTPSTGGFAIVVLEGKNVTKVTGPNGITVEIMPGQMAVVGPAMEGAPRVFTVDLATIIRTSPLIQAFPNPLPSIGDIVFAAVSQQQRPTIQDLNITGAAVSEDGDILVKPSDPPSPFQPDFEMASSSEEDIDTAAGGAGATPYAGPTPPPPAPPTPPNPPVPPPPIPNSLPTALTVTGPATLAAGQLATFTVSMNAPASTPTVVTLNNDFRFGDAPATVTIPAGATSVTFTAQIPSAGVNYSSGSANILASATGMTSGTYSKNLAPTALPDGSYAGAIPGSIESPTSHLRGAKMDLFASHDITLNNVNASFVGGGMEVESFSGKITIQNSTFDGWMQKRVFTPVTPFVVPDFGYGLTIFEETANVAVTAPVLAIKMSPTTPTGSLFTPDGTMFLGDYIVRVQQDPDGISMSSDEIGVNFLDDTASGPDDFDFGSVANGANLILHDGATTWVNDIGYESFDVAAGEYKPNSPASGLNGPSAVGNWEVRASDNSIGGEGRVDEVKLKYGYSKALIQGANGVEIVNVKFEGMNEVEIGASGLGGRVLLSGTLASDPRIGKLAVQAVTSAEKSILTGAGLPSAMEAVAAEINHPNFTGKTDVTLTGDRALQIMAINVAGQLALNSHTVIFNNANVVSGDVIQVRTKTGFVNLAYGSVVPGHANFMGALGNSFTNNKNPASPITMTIGSPGDIATAMSGATPQLSHNGAGTGTVMNVGQVQ